MYFSSPNPILMIYSWILKCLIPCYLSILRDSSIIFYNTLASHEISYAIIKRLGINAIIKIIYSSISCIRLKRKQAKKTRSVLSRIPRQNRYVSDPEPTVTNFLAFYPSFIISAVKLVNNKKGM